MAHVVFLRAANVGGHNVFRPTQLVASLKHLDITNVGAAGTFVVHTKATATEIRESILAKLKFEPEIVTCRASQIMELVESDPFRGMSITKDTRAWVAALCAKPKSTAPALPVSFPATDAWSVRLDRVSHPFAMGFWRRQPGGFVIPANVVQKAIGVSSTVRWWETFVRIAKVIEKRS